MRYQHYKTGDIYTVLYHAVHTEDGTDVVVYQHDRSKVVWVRPAGLFYGYVDVVGLGKPVRRFQVQPSG